MPRTGLSKEEVIDKAIMLVNERGLKALTITSLAEYLGIRKPSLYYHVDSIDEVASEIMIYGWLKVSNELARDSYNDDPFESLNICAHKFYDFAMENPGVFEAMLWYNKSENPKFVDATEGLFNFFFAQTDKLNISRENSKHLVRTYRACMEGFIMLEVHNSFGSPLSVKESFEVSLKVLFEGMKQFENK